LRPLAMPISWQPGCVAHGCDDLLGVKNVLDELQRPGFDTQQVRVNLAARQNDGVIVGRRDLIDRPVDLHRSAPVFFIPTPDFAGSERNDVNVAPAFLRRSRGTSSSAFDARRP
jgi:hypothetical protein